MCVAVWVFAGIYSVSLGRIPFDFQKQDIPLIRRWMVQVRHIYVYIQTYIHTCIYEYMLCM
jgi:hypothetical protein